MEKQIINYENSSWFSKQKLKKVALLFALSGSLAANSLGTVTYASSDNIVLETEDECHCHDCEHDHNIEEIETAKEITVVLASNEVSSKLMGAKLSKSSKSGVITSKPKYSKWKKYNSKLEYRIRYKDGKKEFRKHTFKKWKYNKKTKKDVAVCKTCDYKKTRKHKHTVSKWNYNSKTKKDQGKCSGCKKVIKRTHKHVWSDWLSLNDTYEQRICELDKKIQKRKHSYGEWIFNAEKGIDEAVCLTCGHVISKAHEYHYTDWAYLNDELEYRTRIEDNLEETRSHTYSDWTYNETNKLDESTCSTCGHIKTRKHEESITPTQPSGPSGGGGGGGNTPAHTHTYGNWYQMAGDAEFHYRDCTNNDSTEKQAHTAGNFVYNSATGMDEKKCTVCGYVLETRAHEHQIVWEQDTTDENKINAHCDIEGCNYTDSHTHTFATTPYKDYSGVTSSNEDYFCHEEYFVCEDGENCPIYKDENENVRRFNSVEVNHKFGSVAKEGLTYKAICTDENCDYEIGLAAKTENAAYEELAEICDDEGYEFIDPRLTGSLSNTLSLLRDLRNSLFDMGLPEEKKDFMKRKTRDYRV